MMAFTGVPLLVLTPSTGNDYNIHTAVGAPSYAVRCEVIFNSNRDSTGTGTPAIRTGTTWRAGSEILVKQNAICTARVGSNGSSGAAGNTGASGNTGGNGTPGSSGNPGTAGNTGATGGPGPGGAGGTGGTGGSGY